MTPCGESRKNLEAIRSMNLLSTRQLNIGTWNVRTMFEIGKAMQVAAEMKAYKLALLGISETRWIQAGQKRLSSGELVLYSGHEDENAPHTQGVALMLSKDAQKALICWESHGPRIITAKFRTKHKRINMNVVQCYAPTNDSAEDDKDRFYERLQSIIDAYPQRDINILMGDFNAKVGGDNSGYERIMGREGLGTMNENGERLADFCALNNLVIGGTVFPHKNIHKATWLSPDHITENQIDHICINKKFRRTMEDVRVRRGADVASDHHLLTSKLKLKLRKDWSSQSVRQKYNIALLKDQHKLDEYAVAINNRFQALQEFVEYEQDTIDDRWHKIQEAVTATCNEVLGPRRHHHKEWISAGSLQKLKQRKEKKWL